MLDNRVLIHRPYGATRAQRYNNPHKCCDQELRSVSREPPPDIVQRDVPERRSANGTPRHAYPNKNPRDRDYLPPIRIQSTSPDARRSVPSTMFFQRRYFLPQQRDTWSYEPQG